MNQINIFNPLNSGILEIMSLLQYHLFYSFITNYKNKSIKEIFSKDFYNSFFLGGFIIISYTIFMEKYIINYVKSMKTSYKEIIIYLFLFIALTYIVNKNYCNEKNIKESNFIKKNNKH